MSIEQHEYAPGDLRVTSSDGAVVFIFRESDVVIQLACDTAILSYGDWRHIARVYGSK